MGVDDIADADQPIKQFSVPVDSEHKSKVLRLYSLAWPHHMAFHVNWISFFVSFVSAFAVAPLVVIIRDDLNLTMSSVSGAAIASVTGTTFARIAMGSFTDAFGPRYGHAILLCMTSIAVICTSMVTSSAGFIVSRCVSGFAIAGFVCCQFWTSCMFSANVIGAANAVAGGWGTAGGGATQLIMPYLYQSILSNGVPSFSAWRWALFVPAAMQVILAVAVLFCAQDLPDGNFAELKKSGAKLKGKGYSELFAATKNYRAWLLLITYGYCLGLELTIFNNISSYFSDQFGKSITAAGNLASIFGLFNFICRPAGGVMSDYLAKRYGMRGRLWLTWICQTVGALLCVALGLSSSSFNATVVILILFAIFLQGATGASFGVVPFVSKRSLGLVCGMVGAGGTAGGAINQAMFFSNGSLTTPQAFKWLGVLAVVMTSLQFLLYFPMWGGMLCGPKEGATEEDYYFAEWSEAEKENGDHRSVMKFADEARSQRGMKCIEADATAHARVLPVIV